MLHFRKLILDRPHISASFQLVLWPYQLNFDILTYCLKREISKRCYQEAWRKNLNTQHLMKTSSMGKWFLCTIRCSEPLSSNTEYFLPWHIEWPWQIQWSCVTNSFSFGSKTCHRLRFDDLQALGVTFGAQNHPKLCSPSLIYSTNSLLLHPSIFSILQQPN